METIEKSLVTQRAHGHRAIQRGVDMEVRMTRVETTIAHILKDLDAIKREVRELRIYVDERFRQFEAKMDALEAKMDARFALVDARFAALEAKMDARFAAMESSMRTEFRLVWAGMFAIVGLLAKGFHWI
jgi:uncharacterized coiled-coil protein SlyX